MAAYFLDSSALIKHYVRLLKHPENVCTNPLRSVCSCRFEPS